MSILLKNATYIDWESLEFKKSHIIIRKGVDKKIEFYNEVPARSQFNNVIDCSGKMVTKSFACGHHHAYSALARGMNAPKKIPTNFHEILKYVWWTLDKCLDKEMIEYSALYTAIACAKNGVTFAIDHHASPFSVYHSLEIIAEAFEKVGVSHLLCYEVSDRDGNDIAERGLNETDFYLQRYQGLVGLHASFTLEDDTLQKAAELMKLFNSGVHVHVAEDKYDQEYTKKTFGKSVVERLHDFGFLNSPKSILVHALHLSDNEREIIRKSPAWVVQNMESNLNNSVGYFNSKGLGENIMMGTDGMHSDMLQSAKAAFFTGHLHDDIDYGKTYNRFRNVHNYISSNGFKGDGQNNLVILDYDSPTEINTDNFYGHFLFGLDNKHITHVISDGRIILDNRRITTVDEESILEHSKKLSVKLWDKMSSSNFYE
jgi:cytosine/adenosine deaminase-related metal-dependent hydrolase